MPCVPDRFGRQSRRVEDWLVRELTISIALMGVASVSLIIGALSFATGIILALQQH